MAGRSLWAAAWLAWLCGCEGGGGTTAEATTAGPASTGGESATAGDPGGDPDPTSGAGDASTGGGQVTGSTSQDPATGAPETTGPGTSDPGTTGPGSAGDPTGDPTGDSSGDPSGDPVACEGPVHDGVATYYDADGSGNCSFPAAPGDPLVAAMNDADYAASAVCGACVAIDGPDGKATVRIVDRCPECPPGHIDLHPDAFAMLADPQLGVVPISWAYVPCPVAGNIAYHFKEGSNQWWTAVQVRNHRNAVASFEYRDAMGDWKPVERVDYNFFIDMSGMGPGPYSFRVTDVYGNVLEDAGVPFVEAGESPGGGQFPACSP
jgi:expansin (peptidoglycan-binding protein)